MKLTADEIFNSLKNEFHFESATGRITFNLRDYSIVVEQNNVVGNILEEWLAKWFNSNGYENIHNLKQDAPDFWLNPDNLESEWLEIKSFTGSPNFDIANFRSYINEIIEKPYKLHSKYLLIKYKAEKGIVTIEDFWLKNVWEISCPSSGWPVKVQVKRGIIYNLRPSIWYSDDTSYPSFKSLEHFLAAIEQTIYRYHDTNVLAETWLDKMKKSYKKHYGIELDIPRWFDIKSEYGIV